MRFKRRRYRHIALVIQQDSGYLSNVLRGISDYVKTGPPWLFQVFSPAYSQLKPMVDEGRYEGVILAALDPEWGDVLNDAGLPAVNVAYHRHVNLPRVGVDNRMAGRMAAEHLLERGFRRFGYYGRSNIPSSEERLEGFRHALARRGFQCSVFDAYGGSREQYQRRERRWLLDLGRPAGICSAEDFYGMSVEEGCIEAGLAVPEEIAIVSISNDELMCELANPPLSSIAMPGRRVGFEAARLLHRLMRGGKPPARPILFKPLGVVTRHSSEVYAVEDPGVAAALRFIRDNAHRPLGVPDILKAVPMARRSLERQFRQILGRSPLQEIRRQHIERAKQILARTELPIPEVAELSGLVSGQNLAMAFKRETRMTPSGFRRKSRDSASPVDPPSRSARGSGL